MVCNDRAAAKGTLAHPKSAQVPLSRDCCLFPGVKLRDYNVLLGSCSQHVFSPHFVRGVTSFVAVSSPLHLGFLLIHPLRRK